MSLPLREVIRRHYSEFSAMVNPVALASRLDDLTMSDKEDIACQAKSCGHHFAVFELSKAIYSKVEWKELHVALMKEKYFHLAKILEKEYYGQNSAAQDIQCNKKLETQMPKQEVNQCATCQSETSESDYIPSSKNHVDDKENISVSAKSRPPIHDKENISVAAKSSPPISVVNIYYYGDVINSPTQIGNRNKIVSKYGVIQSEKNVIENTTFEVVSENLMNQNSSEINIRRSPTSQNISDGHSVNQSVRNDACLTSDMMSKDSSFKSLVYKRTGDTDDKTPLKTSVRKENECSPQLGERRAVNNNGSSDSPSDFSPLSQNFDGSSAIEKLGISLRKNNGKNERENSMDDDDDEETKLKLFASVA